MRYILNFIFILFLFNNIYASTNKETLVSETNKKYLESLYNATFRCITHFVNKGSGLPYDVSDYRKATSISNIGLYLAAVAVGSKTEIITKQEAINKIDKTLSSLEKIQKWNGFPITWVNVENLNQEYDSHFSYADHVGNLICGLLVVEGVFKQAYSKRIESFISQMDFAETYETNNFWLKGGYDTKKKDFVIKQEWGEWYYSLFASDTRPFSLIGITLNQIPEVHWSKLIRDKNPWGEIDKQFKNMFQDIVYYSPGMQGGGIFMQYLPGIFLPERDLPIGTSARNLAKSQIEFSKKKGYYPFWGISSSESPDGKSYLGWGTLKTNVVTPHACVLAISDFPKETIKCLRALEKKKMRPVYKTDQGEFDFGFTDSYDIDQNTASKNYLVLDQCMLFLSLANFLYNDAVKEGLKKSYLGKSIIDKLKQLEQDRTLD